MNFIVDFIDKCKTGVETLTHPKDSTSFFRRFNQPNIFPDEDVDNLFECFKMTIKSMTVSFDQKQSRQMHVSIVRHFTKEEVLSGKRKCIECLTSFLWSLGYKLLGPGTWHLEYEQEKAKCLEILYTIACIFRDTAPPVRSLQSLAYSFTRQLNIDTDLYENNTLSEMEGVELSKVVDFTIYADALEIAIEEGECVCPVEKRNFVESYHFVTALKGLEENIVIEHGIRLNDNGLDSTVIERCLVIDARNLTYNNMSLKHALTKCFNLLKVSSTIVFPHFTPWSSFDLWGLSIDQSPYSENVAALMIDLNIGLLELKGTFLQSCEVNPFVGCGVCIAREAEFDACLVLLMHAFMRFWHLA